jgi:cell division transport system permease protein
MIGLRRRPARADLPLGRDEAARFLPWVFALMVYVAAMAGVGLVVLYDTLHAADRSLGATLTLEVPADTSEARLETVLAALRQTRGVLAVHLLEPAETARLLEPILGSPVTLDGLPVPRLIDVGVDPDGSIDFTTLRQHLASLVPEARLDDHRAALVGVRAASRRLAGILAAAIAAALLLIAASAGFTGRLGRAGALLHDLGAADGDIARPLAKRSLRLGLLGGVIGAAAALVTILAVGGADAVIRLPAPVATMGIGDWRLWAVLAGSVLAACIIAMTGARVTVMRRLARMP